jgi:hypothetical protein
MAKASKNISENLSRFVLISGPRGSQKTLLMTHYVVKLLLKSFYLRELRGIEKRVWTNYPVGFNFRSKLDGKVHHLESEPLNMQALYLFDHSLANGWAFIDEIDQWYDRQGWSEVTQRLTSAALTQIRKRHLSLGATIQDADWLNSRGQFQLDIGISCREAAFTPWGRKVGLGLGERSFLTSRDISGVMTGFMFKETERTYSSDFVGKQFWNCYDTDYQFDPMESKTKYKIKRPTREFELTDGGYRELNDDLDEITPYKSGKKDSNQVLIADLVHELVESGTKTLSRSEFWLKAGDKGFVSTSGSITKAGMVLASLGVDKGDKSYSFENLIKRNQLVSSLPPTIKHPPTPPKSNTDETQPVVPSSTRQYTHSRASKKKSLAKAGKK